MLGMQYITEDRYIQTLWIKRFIAFLIDILLISLLSVVILLPFGILSFALGSNLILSPSTLMVGTLYLIYATLFEGVSGATVGKHLMELKVLSTTKELDLAKAFVRNLTKIATPLLALDVLLFIVTEGDPRQRFLDRIAGTYVVCKSGNLNFIPKFFRGSQPPPPYRSPGEWR